MNIGRFVGAVAGVAVVRALLNMVFYGYVMRGNWDQVLDTHPDVVREVIWGFVATDILFALIFVFLWIRVAPCLGGGVGGGARLGLIIGLFFGVVANLYLFFSFHIFSVGTISADAIYQIIAVAIQGAVAGAIYKAEGTGSGTAAAPAG